MVAASLDSEPDLLGQAFHDDPAPVLARLRRDRPVTWIPALGSWVLTRHADWLARERSQRG